MLSVQSFFHCPYRESSSIFYCPAAKRLLPPVQSVFYQPKEKQAQAESKKAKFHQLEGGSGLHVRGRARA